MNGLNDGVQRITAIKMQATLCHKRRLLTAVVMATDETGRVLCAMQCGHTMNLI